MRELSLRVNGRGCHPVSGTGGEGNVCVSGIRRRRRRRKNATHRRNSGVALYFSNSSSHSVSESGGRTPVTGRHSVMLRPDSVRRVTPPTTMTAMTRVEESMSHFPTAGGESTGSCCSAPGCCCECPPPPPFEEKKRGSCLNTDLPVVVSGVGPDGG